MLRGIELQFRTRSRLIVTEKGEALAVQFRLGPLAIYVIANLPEYEGEYGKAPLAYIKITLDPTDDWPVFKNHESGPDVRAKLPDI